MDESDEKLGYKIRKAQMQKIPYTIVLGDNELKEETVTVRQYGKPETERVPLEYFKEKLVRQIKERSM
jgi:threonyl-tRNA synthetase